MTTKIEYKLIKHLTLKKLKSLSAVMQGFLDGKIDKKILFGELRNCGYDNFEMVNYYKVLEQERIRRNECF